jgi:copper chaperone CopZ
MRRLSLPHTKLRIFRNMTNQHRQGVAHHLPHRTRYRLAKKYRDTDTVNRIRKSISDVPGVQNVDINGQTGSILVHHEENPCMLEALAGAFEDVAGDIFQEITTAEIEGLIPGASIIGYVIKKRFSDWNSHVSGVSNNVIDLKMLLPIGFLLAGLHKIAKNQSWFAEVPAWVLLYYAYDSYLRFHGPTVTPISSTPSSGNALRSMK